jgi:PadR family transcriptional regulator, regulatory protein PadR
MRHEIFLDLALYLLYNAMEMVSAGSLGDFEQIVLLAILRLGETAYGVSIAAEIAACTDRRPAPGALYTTLDRLEEKSLVASRLGDPTPSRGGRAKRYFTVTRTGMEAVAAAQRNYSRLCRGLNLPGISHA